MIAKELDLKHVKLVMGHKQRHNTTLIKTH